MDWFDLGAVAVGGLIGIAGTILAARLEHRHVLRREEIDRHERSFALLMDAMQGYEGSPGPENHRELQRAIERLYLLPRCEVFDYMRDYVTSAVGWHNTPEPSAERSRAQGPMMLNASQVHAAMSRVLCALRNGKPPLVQRKTAGTGDSGQPPACAD